MKVAGKLWSLGMSPCFTLLVPTFTFAQHYIQTNLTSDGGVQGANPAHIDANLKNPWGMTRSSGSPWWISDNNAGLSTLYDSTGNPQALIVKIPGPNGSPSDFVSLPRESSTTAARQTSCLSPRPVGHKPRLNSFSAPKTAPSPRGRAAPQRRWW